MVCREESKLKLHLSSPRRIVQRVLNSPSRNVCLHMWSVANQGNPPRSGDQRFCLFVRLFLEGGSSYRYGALLWLTLTIQSPNPPEGQTDTMWPRPQAFVINHIVCIKYLLWPLPPGIKRHSSQAGYSRLPSGTGQGTVFQLDCEGLSSSSLLH